MFRGGIVASEPVAVRTFATAEWLTSTAARDCLWKEKTHFGTFYNKWYLKIFVSQSNLYDQKYNESNCMNVLKLTTRSILLINYYNNFCNLLLVEQVRRGKVISITIMMRRIFLKILTNRNIFLLPLDSLCWNKF